MDPIFRDATGGVLTLCACSPCIDTGAETLEQQGPDEILLQYDHTDLDDDGVDIADEEDNGERTPWDIKDMERVIEYPERGNGAAILDLGATEECPGDVDGDGDIDISDLSILLSAFGSTGCTSGACARANLICDGSAVVDIADLSFLLENFGNVCSPGWDPPGLTSGGVSTAVTAYDTSSYSGSGFEGEKHHVVFDVFCTIAESADDWTGSGVTVTVANGATLRLVPNAGNPPTPGDSIPEKYTTFFGEPRAVNYSGRFTNPLPNGAIVGKYDTGTGAYTYTSTAINAAWYDMNASSNDGPAAVFRIVINVSGVNGADTSGGLGSVYFTTGSPGSGDIKVADMTFDVEHKYADSGSTVTVGSFYVTD